MGTLAIYWNAIRIIMVRLTLGVFEFAIVFAFGVGWVLRIYARGIQLMNVWYALRDDPLGILGDALVVGGIAAAVTLLVGLIAAVVVATITALAFKPMQNRDRYAGLTRALALVLAIAGALGMAFVILSLRQIPLPAAYPFTLFIFHFLPEIRLPVTNPITLFVLVLPVPLAAAIELYRLVSRNFTGWYINKSYLL